MKAQALADLVTKRRNEAPPDSKYLNLSMVDGGIYDFEFVVPWTKSAKNLDADLMLIAQDWASQDFLRKRNSPEEQEKRKASGQDEGLATNKNLRALLKAHFHLE